MYTKDLMKIIMAELKIIYIHCTVSDNDLAQNQQL